MKKRVVLFLVSFFFWCLLIWPLDWQHLIVGILVAALVAFVIGDFFVARLSLLKDPRRYWYFIVYYVPLFLWECLKANLDVAYLVIHPNLPIRPGIVKVKTRLKSDMGLAFLANTITLTPGTMSVDLDRDNGILYIHWIYVRTTDTEAATRAIVDVFENILEKIFE
ncbi:MAG: Na+/H+ antiporter subunit E [Elusimicrobia bacterium]|nr:Na+/H+ antiporter subunit E [Candidatus Obscuribacterium magneticum]